MPPFAILGIDHVVLRARDPARLERFYVEVLGCSVARRQDELGLTQLRAGRCLIDLLDAAGPLGREGGAPPEREGRNMDHLCLRVEPFNGEALRAFLAARGAAPGEVVRRFGAEGEGPSLYLHDPDGNMVELKGPADGA
ncbi:MAG: VOC family protein [Rhodospirillaceae bacterium]|nr:VOC family protein [Rhodospirillaceae bacterium]